MSAAEGRLALELGMAEQKAWDSLGRYKFLMFGYHAAHWVKFNCIGDFKRPNPFKGLVLLARDKTLRASPENDAGPQSQQVSDLIGRVQDLSCDDQFAIAIAVAANVGYVLKPEPMIQQ